MKASADRILLISRLTLTQSTTRGYANLPKGVTGTCKAKYYFSGDPQNGVSLSGPAIPSKDTSLTIPFSSIAQPVP